MKTNTNISFEVNNFSVIRLVCCVLIMISHLLVNTYGLSNIPVPKSTLFAGSSLVCFFMLSGFLISSSLKRNATFLYIKKRILRLYPVYVTSLVAICIVGNMICDGGGIKETVKYFIFELVNFSCKDYNGISNGAMWAIFIQIQFYICALIFKKFILYNENFALWTTILITLVILNCSTSNIEQFCISHGIEGLFNKYSRSIFPYMYFFFIGIYVYRFFDRIVPFLKKYAYLFLFLHLLWHLGLVTLQFGYRYTDPITAFTVSFACIGLAYKFQPIKLKFDLSYDIYVWHMPVLTTLIALGMVNKVVTIMVSIAIIIIISFISHITIEKKLVQKI